MHDSQYQLWKNSQSQEEHYVHTIVWFYTEPKLAFWMTTINKKYGAIVDIVNQWVV